MDDDALIAIAESIAMDESAPTHARVRALEQIEKIRRRGEPKAADVDEDQPADPMDSLDEFTQRRKRRKAA